MEDHHAPKPSIRRTLVAGGVAFVVGTLVTLAQPAGSRRGEQGLLFDPETQSPKVIAVWKQLEPLPRVIETPPVIIGGMSPSGSSTRCCTARWRRPGRRGSTPGRGGWRG